MEKLIRTEKFCNLIVTYCFRYEDSVIKAQIMGRIFRCELIFLKGHEFLNESMVIKFFGNIYHNYFFNVNVFLVIIKAKSY